MEDYSRKKSKKGFPCGLRDSADFEGRGYEGEVFPNDASPAWSRSAASGGATESIEGGVLTLDLVNPNDVNSTAPVLFCRTHGAPGSFWLADSDIEQGYTTELDLHLEKAHAPEHRLMLFGIRNNQVGCQVGGEVVLEFRSEPVRWWNWPHNVMAEGQENTGDFHRFRIAKLAGKNIWVAWRDGAMIGAFMIDGPGNITELLFGSTTPNWFSGKVKIDYIRWDTTVAYAPVESETTSVPWRLTVPAEYQVFTAMELEVETRPGSAYKVEASSDLTIWTEVTDLIPGTGENLNRLISLGQEVDRGFYRLQVVEGGNED